MQILYIEDEPNDAQLVDRYIRVTPHKVRIIDSLIETQSVLENPPDLIMVDMIIGQARGGYRFIRQLREQGYTQPIIAVTGLSMPNDIKQCYEAGCTDVLSKPYTIDQLANLLNKYTV